jgi:hypothetical protein
VAWPKEGLVGVAVSDKILFTEKTCRNGAEEPALNFRSAPESDRLLRCRELTLWAISDISHCAKSASERVTGTRCLPKTPER